MRAALCQPARRQLTPPPPNSSCAATGGPGWPRNAGWGSETDVCTWEGVHCDPQGYVDALVLFANALVGELPASLTTLAHLTKLDLSVNALTGPIPGGIGTLGLTDLYAAVGVTSVFLRIAR